MSGMGLASDQLRLRFLHIPDDRWKL
eukprot:SAG31_NODE_39414_length_288_cov_1.068783_1_plen_25_part_01